MKHIEDNAEILKGIYRNYCKKPTKEKFQMLMKAALYLGIEIGRQQVISERISFENEE